MNAFNLMAQQLAAPADAAMPEPDGGQPDGTLTYRLLRYVQAHPGSTARELSEALGMKRTANVSAMLLRYIKAGLVLVHNEPWPPRYTMVSDPEKLQVIFDEKQKAGRMTVRWKMLLQANGELLQWVEADKPPEDDRTVLVWTGTGFACAWHDKHMGWLACVDGGQLGDVTHWTDVSGPPAARDLEAEAA